MGDPVHPPRASGAAEIDKRSAVVQLLTGIAQAAGGSIFSCCINPRVPPLRLLFGSHVASSHLPPRLECEPSQLLEFRCLCSCRADVICFLLRFIFPF
ncbi:hypothetical protein AVEN_200763-1 [Araneus ventricosus]|uniref:Uncharacterized protein n=1 Tax=Araneus ventricosus TaxID=182803 RepID=A0A4Y2DZK3_ARAVE|nr:hypothetical protein AVEN_200763-1 [Araneus ventricosus]